MQSNATQCVRLDDAFTAEQAQAAVSVLYGAAGIDPEDPSSWSSPVIRIDGSTHPVVIVSRVVLMVSTS